MSVGSLSHVLSCSFVGAAALFIAAPAALADPPEWEVPKSCSGTLGTSDDSADFKSCIYAYEGALKAFGNLTTKNGASTVENCTMVVTIIDKSASDEVVASSDPMPCFNGSYPSPPLTVDKDKVKPGHGYVSFVELTRPGHDPARINSPELKP